METDSNRIPAAMSSHDNVHEEGSSDGPCLFTVHGITRAEYGKMSIQNLKARALQHLESEGKILGIGHDNVPQSLYNNHRLIRKCFRGYFHMVLAALVSSCTKKIFLN